MIVDNILPLIAIAALYNVVVFCVYWWDKYAARNRHRRISENTLLGLALFAGSPGALVAQKVLRHKTRKQPFATFLKAIVVLHCVLTAMALTVMAAPDFTLHVVRAVATDLG
ncbi:MAG TPA: DUF1294 domain-containing protein [Rhizobium sp.]|nr:DUF1294 domain-containing protein [Rhizobium sp.]